MALFLRARYRLACSVIFPRSIEETFAVFENPRNLGSITPDWLKFRITTPEPFAMAEGLTLDYRIQWMGIPIPWRTRITAYEPPFLFVDEQIRGPYVGWRHRHTFRELEGGVEVADSVEYELPLGLAGRLAHEAMIAKQLLAIFRFRQHAIGELLGVRGTVVTAPRIDAV